MQAERAAKHMDFLVPRLMDESAEPSTQPCRILPKGAHVVVKTDGTVKKRAITDPAAERRKACQVSKDIWKVFTLEQLREEMRISKGSGAKGIFSKKDRRV